MRLIDADKLENDIVENITVKAVSRMLAITQGQPTVEAVPIEWFKKEIDWHLETATYGAEVYQWVLNRWYEDKENWEKRK